MESVKLKKFNHASPSVYDLNNIDWDLVKGISISDSGSAGVIFVETLMGAFAIKGSSDPAIEYFSYLLLKRLNIKVPEVVVYEFDSPQFQQIVQNLENYCLSDSALWDRVKARIALCFLLVMEFVPNNSICELGTLKAQKLMNPEDSIGQKTLVEIGMIVGIDTLTNMLDRYPIIWDNEGNEANIIFGMQTTFETQSDQVKDFKNLEFKPKGVYAIDNRPFMFSKKNPIAAKNYEKYLDKIKNLTISIFEYLGQVREKKIDISTTARNKSLNKLIEFIKMCTGYDIQTKGDYYLMLGIAISYLNAIELGFDEITKIYDQVYKFAQVNFQESWTDNCKALNIDMINDTINVAKQQISDIDTWLEYISKEGFSEYLIKLNPSSLKEKSSPEILENLSDEFLKSNFGITHETIKAQRELANEFRQLSIEIAERNNQELIEREQMCQKGREETRAKNKPKPKK